MLGESEQPSAEEQVRDQIDQAQADWVAAIDTLDDPVVMFDHVFATAPASLREQRAWLEAEHG